MRSLSKRTKLVLALSILAMALIAVEGVWVYRLSRSERSRFIEIKKTELADLIRGKAVGVLSPAAYADPAASASRAAFREIFTRVQSPEIVRMKIYGADGTVLWSNLSEIIGQKFPDNEEVKEAYRGETVLTIEEQKAEHVSERQYASLAEIYVPLFGSDGKVFGIVEVYQPANLIDDAVFASVRDRALPALAATAAALAVLAAGFAASLKRRPPVKDRRAGSNGAKP